MVQFPHILRAMGFGRILYNLWHRPCGAIRRSKKEGGPFQQIITEFGRRAMISAAGQLRSPSHSVTARPLEVHLLTGHRFWFQTAFCLWSLGTQSRREIVPTLYDDGSLPNKDILTVKQIFPSAQIIKRDASLAALDRYLPISRFPTLRDRWLNYPNIRKLIDPHIGSSGWKLVLDSDLLFFRSPDALLQWYDTREAPIHAIDCAESYGYSNPLMERLAKAPIPPLVNVGICGLASETLDWDEIEHWCATLIGKEKTNYYLEQALIAMLLAKHQSRFILPANDYVTFPRALLKILNPCIAMV